MSKKNKWKKIRNNLGKLMQGRKTVGKVFINGEWRENNWKKQGVLIKKRHVAEDKDDEWNTEICETVCGEVTIHNDISLSLSCIAKISYLMKKFPSTEWSGDLIGTETKDGFSIVDIEIPPQEVTATTVTPNRTSVNPNMVGVIHSHHSMGLFFSSTDTEFANANHRVSVLVAQKPTILGYDFISTIRKKTLCGKYARAKGAISIGVSTPMILKDCENIKEKAYATGTDYFGYGGSFGFYSGHHDGGFNNNIAKAKKEEELKEIERDAILDEQESTESIKGCGYCHLCGSDDIMISAVGEYCRTCQTLIKPSEHGWMFPNEFTACAKITKQ